MTCSISIMSRSDVCRILRASGHNAPANTSIISIRNSEQRRLVADCDGILNLCFDDVLDGEENHMTEEQAQLAADFARAAIEAGRDIIVQCHGGVSRSAGLAAAIVLAFRSEGKGISPTSHKEIWENPAYFPNEHVFALVADAMGHPVTEEDIEALKQANIDAWRAQEL